MVLFNYAIREITAKIVYYGPGLGGKTTNLQHIHEVLDPATRGKLLSLATDGDRTLFFDFLPIEMGSIGGYKVRFQLYTVPGQVHYNATRKLVLKGVDAVAFVADSQVTMFERNRESFENLIENLVENGYDPAKVPTVVQLNKRDLPNVGTPAELIASMGVQGYPVIEAVASRGEGVFETLKTVVKLTLARLRTQFDSEAPSATERVETPPAPPPPPPTGVFAPRPASAAPPPAGASAAPAAPAAAPAAPVAPAAPAAPAAGATAAPPAEAFTEHVDEFDLEELTEEPAARPGATAAQDFGVPEAGSAAFLEPALPGAAPPAFLDEEEAATRRAFFEDFAAAGGEEPAAPPPAAAAPRSAGDAGHAGEPPPWAAGILEEIARLREENRELRAALLGLAGVFDRQVGILEEGRDALARSLVTGAGGGEGAG